MSTSPRNKALADHFYRRIARIGEQKTRELASQHEALRRLLQEQFERATEEDRLSFSTRYARISYVAHKLSLPRSSPTSNGSFVRRNRRRRTRTVSY